jgi:hypothetical protein
MERKSHHQQLGCMSLHKGVLVVHGWLVLNFIFRLENWSRYRLHSPRLELEYGRVSEVNKKLPPKTSLINCYIM